MSLVSLDLKANSLPPYREPLFTLFFIGASVAVEVAGAGRLMGPDLLCSLGLAAVFLRHAPLATQGLRNLLLMLGLWFASAVVTDMIKQVPLDDILRGWSKIVVLAFVLVYLATVSRGRVEPVIAFLAGLNVGLIAKLFIYETYGFKDDPWKFGFGPPTTFFVLCALSSRRFSSALGIMGQCIVVLALAAVNLAGNTRSIFGVLIGLAALLFAAHRCDQARRGQRLQVAIFISLLAGGLILYQGVSTTYSYLADQGILGEAAKQKFDAQEALGLGLLQGGRVESLVSMKAIADSPIIGHGSWARDPFYVEMLLDELQGRGATMLGDTKQQIEDGLIPTHSHLLGAWVEAGVLGAAFWAYVFCFALVALYAAFHIPPRWRPLVMFTILNLIWDIWFSPFSAERRYFVPAELLMLVWAIRHLASLPSGRLVEKRMLYRGIQ